jgi:hypothetical protein
MERPEGRCRYLPRGGIRGGESDPICFEIGRMSDANRTRPDGMSAGARITMDLDIVSLIAHNVAH